MCFKLGMCFGGEDYYRATPTTTRDPYDDPPARPANANYKGYRPPPYYQAAAAGETSRIAYNDVVPTKDHATAAVYQQHQEKPLYAYPLADEPSPRLPAAARNSKVADDTTAVKQQPAAAAVPAAVVRY